MRRARSDLLRFVVIIYFQHGLAGPRDFIFDKSEPAAQPYPTVQILFLELEPLYIAVLKKGCEACTAA